MKNIIIIISLFFLFSCKKHNDFSSKSSNFIGHWVVLTPDSVYYEYNIFQDSLSIYTYDELSYGPVKYIIRNDSIIMPLLSFKIDSVTCNEIYLRTKLNNNMTLERVGYYNNRNLNSKILLLRKIHFLVEKEIISSDSAFNILKQYKKIKIEEELI